MKKKETEKGQLVRPTEKIFSRGVHKTKKKKGKNEERARKEKYQAVT